MYLRLSNLYMQFSAHLSEYMHPEMHKSNVTKKSTFIDYFMRMKGRGLQILINIIGCAFFLSLPVLFSPDLTHPAEIYKSPFFQLDFIGYAILIVFFYLNYFMLIPKYYFRKKYILFALLVFSCYVVVSLIPRYFISGNILFPATLGVLPEEMTFASKRPNFLHYLNHFFFEFLIVFIFSLLIKINNRLKLAQKEKVNAELSYLKAQINPHFLFNTLNSIYSLAIEKSDYTPTAVVKLSGMMRYVITDASNKFVPLEKEINYISDYIELQKIRIDKTIKLTFHVTGDVSHKRIAPLVLISFIENAFKYGVNAEENSEIIINIDITKAYLHLRIFNKKVKIQQVNHTSSGLGIENTKNRLQLLYPGSHKLVIQDNKDDFSILLSLYLL